MTIKKYTQAEGKLEVLRGLEAEVINQHFSKTGKTKVSDFSSEELDALDIDLEIAREKEQRDNSPDL